MVINMKILLCCNAGMSSSILVKKIKQVAEGRGMKIEIKAIASQGVKEEKGKWDVCLVGPQIVYAVESIRKQLCIPTDSIEPAVYALADGEKVLDHAINLMSKGCD